MPPFQQPSSPSPPPQSTDVKPPPVAAPLLPPPPREVATGLSNLGNTCYINASIQALAHAPELCMALDIESHIKECPIAHRNNTRRLKRLAHKSIPRSPSSCSDDSSSSKSKKKKKPARQEETSIPYDPELKGDTQDEFCTLCEVERLLARTHSRTTADGVGPVVPETFTTGFMEHVAPWFRRGVQEDSHEFLRLLIDAMQNSCKAARTAKKIHKDDGGAEDNEYPFRLFRGTVESNVTCNACRYVSCKIDPIEDIGLDILPIKSTNNSGSRSRSSTARTTSPTPPPLAAISEALERFTSIESLDSGYKCEKCGKVGKATKTSKLASIPPILTLHLKRFRYGSLNSSGVIQRSSRGISDSGPSGSAKIEGHVAFRSILDIKPYLTSNLQESTFKKAFCRLFAVVVHNGKNSHSGHYISYVQSLNSKEWWKMDDAKVCRVGVQEVLGCEAYMLFYRVVDHPVSKGLGEEVGRRMEEERRVRVEMERRVREAVERGRVEEEEKASAAAASAVSTKTKKEEEVTTEPKKENTSKPQDETTTKRKRPSLTSGIEWAKTSTTLPPTYYPLLQQIQDYISENVTFHPSFFTYIQQECTRMSRNKKIKTLLGKGPAGVYPPKDVVNGGEDIRDGILDLFHMISCLCKNEEGGSFILPKLVPEVDESAVEGVLPEGEAKEVIKAVTASDELILPDPGEGYDGAL